MRIFFRVALALTFAALAACSSPDTDARVDATSAVRGPDFLPVADLLADRCGSLECHGSKYRNMHLFGFGGSRLLPTDLPNTQATTLAEAEATYEAVVSLEPAKFRQVIAEGGASPERLTFYRKGLLLEAHKGTQKIVPGDPADVCLRSWLASRIDAAACAAGITRIQ